MRKLVMICALAAPVFAIAQNGGQAIVISGHASNWVEPLRRTALTDVPLVNTPSVTLDATPLSATHGVFAQLSWYGPGTVSEVPDDPSTAPALPQDRNFVNVGVGTSEDSKGLAELMAEEQPSRRIAMRVYTNRDVTRVVQQLDQSIGLVKYRKTTKQLH